MFSSLEEETQQRAYVYTHTHIHIIYVQKRPYEHSRGERLRGMCTVKATHKELDIIPTYDDV